MDFFKYFDENTTTVKTKNTECVHENVILESNRKVCEGCGKELEQEVSHEKDWRYYGTRNDVKSSCRSNCSGVVGIKL